MSGEHGQNSIISLPAVAFIGFRGLLHLGQDKTTFDELLQKSREA